MKYILITFAIGTSLMVLTILGEILADKLPDTHWFSKWWKAHIIDEAPKDTDI
jgi:hypothetical protein